MSAASLPSGSTWFERRGLARHALDGAAVARLLPHAPPFLLVDRVLGHRPRPPAMAASLTITGDEPVLTGHFPDRPVWPGSYTIEGLAQTCALLGALAPAAPPGAPILVAAVKVKLLAVVVPPATLDYLVSLSADLGTHLRFTVEAWVGPQQVATGSLDVTSGRTA